MIYNQKSESKHHKIHVIAAMDNVIRQVMGLDQFVLLVDQAYMVMVVIMIIVGNVNKPSVMRTQAK